MDVIEKLDNVLRDPHTIRELEKHMIKILKHYDIIKSEEAVKVGLEKGNTPNCFFGLKVDKKDNLKYYQDLVIIIKPDHSKHRVLRVMVYLDGESISKTKDEDKKHPDWEDENIFFKELKDIERVIKTFFNKTK